MVSVARPADWRQPGARNESRALIDYDEIDALLKAIDVMARVDETSPRLVGFEARYRTLGDLEIGVFRQTRSGNAVMMSTGICDRATGTLSLDDLAKVKAMIRKQKVGSTNWKLQALLIPPTDGGWIQARPTEGLVVVRTTSYSRLAGINRSTNSRWWNSRVL